MRGRCRPPGWGPTFKWSPDGTFGLGVDVEAAHGHAGSGDLAIDLIGLFTELGDTAYPGFHSLSQQGDFA